MKSKSNSNSMMKTIAVAATAAVLIASNPLNSFAGTAWKSNTKTTRIPESTVNVQYIGSNDKMYEFTVEFENPTAQKFMLIVKNDEGEVVFSKEYSDVHFAKTIHLMKDGTDMENIRPTFVISEGAKSVERSFSIERKVTESVSVTKL